MTVERADQTLTLMCVLAHPDDESLGTGGILARYADEGIATALITATRGEYGWPGAEDDYPGPTALAAIRTDELHAAARVLGVRDLAFLNYVDGELDRADRDEVTAALVAHLRRVRPHVVVTFGPDGVTGHPDHIAISQFTTAAIVCAADPAYAPTTDWPAHRVSKLYYLVEPHAKITAYDAVFGESAMTVDGQKRLSPGWLDWAITTHIDTSQYWRQVWQAIACHRTQLPSYETLAELPAAQQAYLWGSQNFYRAFSLVTSGRSVEDDLFAGLRESVR